MVHRIIVPLDGSTASEQSLPAALGIAQRDGATIELVHVYESLPSYQTQGAPIIDPALDEELRKDREAYLARVAGRLPPTNGGTVRHTVLDGPTAATLAEHIASRQADLVVMTTHGRSGLSRVWLGSVAMDLVRRVEPPVLLVRPAKGGPPSEVAKPFQRVLLPLDGSSTGEDAIGRAVAVAGDAAAFVLLHVMQPVIYFASEPHSLVYPGETAMRAAIERYLESVVTPLRDSGLHVDTAVIRHAQPAQAIVEFAESTGADMIAMETRGRTGVDRLIMGSVADKVLRAVSIPMLLHRPRAESTPAAGEQTSEFAESAADQR